MDRASRLVAINARAASNLDFVLVAVAAGWGVLLLGLAMVLPVEIDESYNKPGVQPMFSLVHINGTRVLWLVAIPLATAVAVGVLLFLHRRRRWRITQMLAIVAAGALTVAGVVGTVTFLIGIYVIPCGVILIAACMQHRRIWLHLQPTSTLPRPVPGWYADPARSADLRYWDGNEWTGWAHQSSATGPPTGF